VQRVKRNGKMNRKFPVRNFASSFVLRRIFSLEGGEGGRATIICVAPTLMPCLNILFSFSHSIQMAHESQSTSPATYNNLSF
jgi:hypothetical protein